MLRKTLQAVAFATLAVAGASALAQDNEPKVGYVYALYYECDGSLALVDELIDKYHAPLLDAAVKDGTIAGWGWLAHHTGGTWERVAYIVGTSLDGAMDGINKVGERIGKEIPVANREFFGNCRRHEDYVWRTAAGRDATPGTERGTAGLSVYWKCDTTRESRADELVSKVYGPVLDAQVASGLLTSWGWLEHVLGGEYRRLWTLTGPDFKSVLKARDTMISEMQSQQAEAMQEFGAICGTHVDYLWDIQKSTP